MKHLLLSLTLLVMILAACAPAVTPEPTVAPTVIPTEAPTAVPTPLGPFDYDASRPFETKITSETEQDGVIIVDLTYKTHSDSYASNLGSRTIAYLVKPKGDGPFPAVIYLHPMGMNGSYVSNRKAYLDEAIEMAKSGVVCLLPQGNFPWMATFVFDERDVAQYTGQITELRRAVDFAVSQPNVDKNRLGFVGHNVSAMYGAVIAGIDRRMKAYVFVAPFPEYDYLAFGYSVDKAKYRDLTHDLSPLVWVGKSAPASMFFQFGTKDSFLKQDEMQAMFDAASEPKSVTWYDDIHAMSKPEVKRDRVAWLLKQLDVQP